MNRLSQGVIIGLRRYTTQYAYQGIKGGRSYENCPSLGGYYNGYGAFNSYPEHHLVLEWLHNGKKQQQEFRETLIMQSGLQRISQKYIESFNENNKGKVVNLIWDDQDHSWRLADIVPLQF